jgi:hypothetical protein
LICCLFMGVIRMYDPHFYWLAAHSVFGMRKEAAGVPRNHGCLRGLSLKKTAPLAPSRGIATESRINPIRFRSFHSAKFITAETPTHTLELVPEAVRY